MQRTLAIIGTRGYPSYYGGFETAVRQVAPWLADHGWRVRVYSRQLLNVSKVAERDERIDVVVTRGIDTKILSTLTFGLTSTLHAIFHKPDVAVVMNVANGFWLPLLRLRGIPTVVNVDGIEWDRAKWGRFAKRLFYAGAWMTTRWASELVFDARAIRERWIEQFGRGGTYIPYGGIEFEGTTRELPFPDDSFVLLVARLVPENSVFEFIDAARLLDPSIPIVVVGSSGYGDAIDKAVQELSSTRPNVAWLGHLSDDDLLHQLWHRCGVYFHGHSVGGTNPALVQAMACSSPIVARDTVYNREVLGSSARYTRPDPEEIAAELTFVIQSGEVRRGLAINARIRAREQFSWHLVSELYHTTALGVVGARLAGSRAAAHESSSGI